MILNGIARTKKWFEEAVPTPGPKNTNTQLGVHIEEVAEMLAALQGTDRITQSMLTQSTIALHGLALHLKATQDNLKIDRNELLDSLCDQLVTGTGVAHMHAFDIVGALEEVNDSNWSKFVDGKPVFDSNMKIAKGPNYRKPFLAPFC